jgi:hypothetical protein
MHVPCPDCNSTNLQKVSLGSEAVLYRCDKRAQLHGVLGVIGGPGVLLRASTTNDTRQTKFTAQGGGMATRRTCGNTSTRSLSSETFVIQIPVATAASKQLLVARRQNRVAVRAFRANT